MDHFGIGAGVYGAMQVYFRSARRSGRTTSLVESLKDGDIVVFHDIREAQRVAYMCAERGIKIETRVIDPKRPSDVFNRPTPSGYERVIFDHTWVEQFYECAVESAMRDLDTLQREASGYGAAHRETKRKALELARWGNLQPPKKEK